MNNSDDIHQDPQWRHLLEEMKAKVAAAPRLLSRTAGRDSCSIFRVPKSFNELNVERYHPSIVSIGPYHHGEQDLEMMQEHKYVYLSVLLSRTNVELEYLLRTLAPMENQIKESYSEQIRFNRYRLLELLVVDACFIIELFRKFAVLVEFENDDPILSMSWMLPFLIRDLILLENQIPFFVLQTLFESTRGESDREQAENNSLVNLCFKFFGYFVERPPQVVSRLQQPLKAKHLLDLYRSSFIPAEFDTTSISVRPSITGGDMASRLILCISKLLWAGMKLRPPTSGDSESFLAVRFLRNGVIEMPTVTIDDFTSTFIANCVAFEHCHYKTKMHFTAYTTMLDCLIKTEKDVEYLSNHDVIENYLGSKKDLANFINNLQKNVVFDPDTCYLSEFFKQVNHYCSSHWSVQWVAFKYYYVHSPWPTISVVAAFLLLLFSALQTLYTVLSYYKPDKHTSTPT